MEKISQIGERIIRSKAKKVRNPKSAITKRLLNRLNLAMRREALVGIAAPQIGVGLCIFIAYPRSTRFRTQKGQEGEIVFINPVIIRKSRIQTDGYEGCGSVAHADLFGKVKRPSAIEVKAQDQKGEWFHIKAKGLLARIIQHEYDHLEGTLFIDRVQSTKTLLDRASYLQRQG